MNNKDISELRINYGKFELLESEVSSSPMEQFDLWFEEALKGGIKEPNAMILSTASDGKPHARVVLLKGKTAEGFEFYTNYKSQKSRQLEDNPFASLTFFYDALERQILIEGSVEKLSEEESDKYFWSRPRGSQIGAWVSEQSSVIASREALNSRKDYYDKLFDNLEVIPRPPHWGGFIVKPYQIEFWQGRPSRLHDRLCYKLEDGNWKIERLSP